MPIYCRGKTRYMTVVVTTDTVPAVEFVPVLGVVTVVPVEPPPPPQAARTDRHPAARAMSSILIRFMVCSFPNRRIRAIAYAGIRTPGIHR
jgi:hypothetical protein